VASLFGALVAWAVSGALLYGAYFLATGMWAERIQVHKLWVLCVLLGSTLGFLGAVGGLALLASPFIDDELEG
jgi:hypothetical protein